MADDDNDIQMKSKHQKESSDVGGNEANEV